MLTQYRRSALALLRAVSLLEKRQEEGSMNAKAIPASSSPGLADPPLDGSAAGQVAMVVMLVPVPTPLTGVSATPPGYVDSNDHVWLLVHKASPMAAVFEQITAP